LKMKLRLRMIERSFGKVHFRNIFHPLDSLKASF
jgi:hypothetical protein